MTVYEQYNNRLCVNQDLLLKHITNNQLQNWCKRSKLTRLRTKGRGRCGLIEWDSVPEEYRAEIKKAYSDPYAKDDVQSFINRLEEDEEAAVYFSKQGLSADKQLQRYIEAIILNLYGQLLTEINQKRIRISGFKVTDAKRNLSHVINELKLQKLPNDKPKYPHNLPTNYRSLERKWNEYDGNYENLIHKGRGNESAAKIKGKIADWILGYYCLPTKPNVYVTWTNYCLEAEQRGWAEVTEGAIRHWLERPQQRKKWFLSRHGKAAWINEYGHKVSRDKSDWFPGCYLAIDGSKLDWIHYKEGAQYNMGADLKIDVVFDAYSEKIVGYYCGSDHENYTQHFSAIKMAVSDNLRKPALITYDNQGGHKMAEMQELYNQLVTTNGGQHYPHRAREHGSPAEGLFGRFQQQVLNTVWWSDKQAVTVRKEDSRPNMEFVKKHRHKLKQLDELIEAFEYYVQKWNEAEHPLHKGQSRNEVAKHEVMYKLDKITELDMISMFWITSKDALTYKNTGFTPTIRGEKYHFEVYDADGCVDIDFRDKYTGCKFHYQYDPGQLDNYVRLYLKLPNGQTKYVADAQIVKKVRNIPALMDEHDQNRKHKMLHVRDEELSRIEAELEALQYRTGITEEKIIEDQELELKFRGAVPKKARAKAEAGAGSWTSKM